MRSDATSTKFAFRPHSGPMTMSLVVVVKHTGSGVPVRDGACPFVKDSPGSLRGIGRLIPQAQKEFQSLIDGRKFRRRYLPKHPADTPLVDRANVVD